MIAITSRCTWAMRHRNLLWGGLALLIALSWLGWVQAAGDRVRVGVVKNFPPHYEIDPTDGAPQGFAIEVFNDIAERAGLQPEYIIFDNWEQVQQALREQTIDVIPNMGITAERRAQMRFTSPVETTPVRLYVRASDARIKGVDDLIGRRVSVVKTNIGVTLVNTYEGTQPAIHNSPQEALLALLAGETDALILPQPVVTLLLRQSGLESRIKPVGEALAEVMRAVAVRSDHPALLERLDQAVQVVIASDHYFDTYRRWYGAPKPLWTVTTVLLLSIGVVLLVGGGFWLWRYRTIMAYEQLLAAQRAEQREQQLRAQSTEAVAKLQIFFEQSPYLAGIMDLDGTLTEANRAALEGCGYRREEQLGKPFWETGWWHGSVEIQRQIRTAVTCAAGGETFRRVLPYWLADGSERRTDFALNPVYNDAGEVIFLAPTGSDVTERERTAQVLEAARREAEIANRAKSEFLANMSHELRTPMSAILGYADVLASHLQDPDDLSGIEIIRRNGRYLLEILNDVLDLAKIEAGKLDVEIKSCTPTEVVDEVHSLMSVAAQEKGLKFIVEYDGAVPVVIQTDPVRLRQILINLLGNAVKFTEQGEARLTVRLLTHELTDARLLFIVSDTGIGISPARLASIFNPFEQGDTTSTRRFGGTGLGLTISRRLAALLGGEIIVESQENQGSTFTLTVGVGDLSHVQLIEPQPIHSDDTVPYTPPRLDGYNVLVVDDRSDIRILVQRLIEEAGGTTQAASDGQATLIRVADSIANGKPFDAVVMDMQMPVMDGFEATRRLRAQGFERPIIALTAGAMLGEREKCLEAGCSAYLSKPVEGRRLLEFIANTASVQRLITEPPVQSGDALPIEENAKEYRVLVVDDNQDAAMALKLVLDLNGFTVDTAFDGREALQKAETYPPEAVILDLNLPDMSGYEVLAQMRSQSALARTCFIALSGENPGNTASPAVQFDHHLVKPAAVEELIKLLGR